MDICPLSLQTPKGNTMKLIREVQQLPTEGEHDVVIVDLEDLGVTRWKYQDEHKLSITFETLDQMANEKPVRFAQTYAVRFKSDKNHNKSHFLRLIEGMGFVWKDGEFDTDWLLGQRLHVVIQHAKSGQFANIVHVVKDPTVVRENKCLLKRPTKCGCGKPADPEFSAEIHRTLPEWLPDDGWCGVDKCVFSKHARHQSEVACKIR